MMWMLLLFCFASRRQHTRCSLVSGVLTCALPIFAALRPHLLLPHLSRPVESDAGQVAMAERPDLRGHATFIREGIVCGNAAVGLQPDDLAQILAHVLRRVELLPLARGDEEILEIGRAHV